MVAPSAKPPARPQSPESAPTGPPSWWPDSGRDTHAVIDLDAITGNVVTIRRYVSPANVIAVVKANAYGHGAVMVADAAIAAGATTLAVATVDEGVQLREAGLQAPILVMGPAADAEYASAFRNGLIVSLAEIDQIEPATLAAVKLGTVGEVHLKIETGMNRYGAPAGQVLRVARRLDTTRQLRLGGVFTHFADADGPDLGFTAEQEARFSAILDAMIRDGIDPALTHVANSAGAIRLPSVRQVAVRLGIGLYGLAPAPDIELPHGVRPALRLRSRVAMVRQLRPGDTVSYGRTYQATGNETVALIPVGYGDGLRRAASATGWMDLAGEQAPIRGRVCMDQTVVAAPSGIRRGDPVTVIGDGSDAAQTADDLARMAGTINYEIATGIAGRVPRWYLRNGRPVALEQRGVVTRF